jgi:hypothetical protein
MGPEEVRDDIIEPLLNKLSLKVDRIDFTGFDFASIITPRDIAAFIVRVASLQYVGGTVNFLNGDDRT